MEAPQWEPLGPLVLLLLVDLDQDLAALGPLGGFFVLRTGGAPHAPLPTLAAAYTAYTDSAYTTHAHTTYAPYADENQFSDAFRNPITFRVKKVAHSLRAPEMRVAASVAQQGLAARLWSVTLACAVLYGGIPDLDPGLVHWDPDAGAPDDLWLSEIRPLPADSATVADVVLEGHLEPLAAALRARHRIAPGLLRGNAASALAGAARQLDQWARAHGHPRAAAHTRSLTVELLAHPLLSGTGTLTGTSFRRRSCCLYYRVPGGGLCGDCCFTRPPRSSAHDTSG